MRSKLAQTRWIVVVVLLGAATALEAQTTLTITSNHAQAQAIRQALEAVSQLLQRLRQTAEQLTAKQRWRQLLRFIFRDWLKNQSPDPVFFPLPMLDNCRI